MAEALAKNYITDGRPKNKIFRGAKFMNKILSLLDKDYVIALFRREVLPHYSAFSEVVDVEIHPYKHLIWETTYHVVIGYNTYFRKTTGEEDKIPIVCSAHSEEPRENIYTALRYLWSVSFPTAEIDIPDPLFYSEEFRGTFYRGLRGDNLLHFIRHEDWPEIEKIVLASAQLLARLHGLPAGPATNFNPLNSRIRTAIPGVTTIRQEVAARYHGYYQPDLEKIYGELMSREEDYLSDPGHLRLIHGDFHPENILQTAPDRLGLIDFTDMSRSDPARDLGSFKQQLEYKIRTKTAEPERFAPLWSQFLTAYLTASGASLTDDLAARIELYYNWTALRTAIFWFLKADPSEERGRELLDQVKANLHI